MKHIVTTQISNYTWAPICQVCSHVPCPGDIMEDIEVGDKQRVRCSYCGYTYDYRNSVHIMKNSLSENSIEEQYLEGKGPNIKVVK